MKRIASHYIVYGHESYRMHYLELDDGNCVQGIYPLVEEIASTVFCDGIIFLISENTVNDLKKIENILYQRCKDEPSRNLVQLLSQLLSENEPGKPVPVVPCRLKTTNLSASEFCTNYCRGNCYIERL